MSRLLAILVASTFAFGSAGALAADPPKDAATAAKAAPAKLEKPANVTQEAWDKMSDADKKKAIEKAKPAATAAADAPKEKKKKGGC